MTFETEIEIFCGSCNTGLCNQSNMRTSRIRSMPQIVVEPCQHCLDEAEEKGRQKGIRESEDRIEDRIEELESYIEDLQHK